MQTKHRHHWLILSTVAAILSTPVAVLAQAAPSRTTRVPLRITRMPVLTRVSTKTPVYTTSVARSGSARTNKEWGAFVVEYETAPKWLDSVTFTYYVMSKGENDEGAVAFSLFKTAVTYVNVAEGSHKSMVYLRPSAMARYGEPVAVAVEITADGTQIEPKSVERGITMPDGAWWKNPLVVDRDTVTVRDGYLLPHTQTPFALINIDDNEEVQ